MKQDVFDKDVFDQALADIDEWAADNRDQLKGEGLAPGASEDEIAAAEKLVGEFPADLKELYRCHNGQRPRYVALTPWGYVASLQQALEDFVHMLGVYFDGPARPMDATTEALASLRDRLSGEVATRLKGNEDRLRDEELTMQWWPLVVGNGEYFAVHLGTGRVFELTKAGYAALFVAESVTEWLSDYADQVWNDEIVIDAQSGFVSRA